MIEYYIIGSGGCGRDILFNLLDTLDIRTHTFKGFIELRPKKAAIDCLGNTFPLIDEDLFLENIKPNNSIKLYFGIGDPLILKKIYPLYKRYNFPNFFHKSFIGDHNSIKIGKGNIINAGTTFTGDIVLGDFNLINCQVSITHETEIGDFNIINPGANLSGGVKIGNANLIGSNSVTLQYLKLGNNNIIGAGAVQIKNMKNNEVWVGNPARKIRDNV